MNRIGRFFVVRVLATGIFVALAVFALAFTACSQPVEPKNNPNEASNNPGETSGKLTVNGLPGGITYEVYYSQMERIFLLLPLLPTPTLPTVIRR